MPHKAQSAASAVRPAVLHSGRGAAVAALALAFAGTMLSPALAQEQYQAAPPPDQYQNAPPPGQYQYPPPQAQYQNPPPQYQNAPPPGQYPPQQYQYAPAPSAEYAEPVAPPGAIWVGAPGECLYGNGSVYWCAPGVVFTGFPAWWDFARYPVYGFGAGIVVDPIWFGGWRRGHPGFEFRGRLASEAERGAFFEHRQEIVRAQYARPPQHDGRREER